MLSTLPLEDRWALVTPHRSRLVALVRRHCANADDAEDCAQEALLRAVSMPNLDAARVGPLLTVIAMRLAADTHRHRARQRRAGARIAEPEERSVEEVIGDRAEATWLVGRARMMSARERAAVALCAEGLTPGESAERLGVPTKSVYLALGRARTHLRAALAAVASLGALIRRLRSGGRLAPAGAVSIGLTSALLLFGGAPPSAGAMETPRGPALHGPAMQRLGPGGAPESRSATDTGRLALPGVAGATISSTQVVAGSDVRAATVNAPVQIERRHGDQSLAETLQDCLESGGLTLSPTHIGCN